MSVEIGGVRVERRLARRQGVLLLAILVLGRRRPIARESIMEILWPGERPAAAGAGLRALLSKTRAAVGGDALPSGERVQLVLPTDSWVDVEAAEEAIHRAETAVASHDWPSAWGAARVASMITDRGFLIGHENPWVEDRRRDLDHVGERAERCIVACGLALGGGELIAAERASHRLVERRSLDESAVMQRMEVLAAAGDPSAALEAFEALRIRLRDELGALPGERIRALHRHVLGDA